MGDEPAGKRDAAAQPLLCIRNLSTHLFTTRGLVRAVDGVSLEVGEGEAVGLVGESGCGKSMTALSVMGLLPTPPARIVAGEVLFRGIDLTKLSIEQMRRYRGREISTMFQDPMSYLNPVMSVGKQIAESVRLHQGADRVRTAVPEILDLVGFARSARVWERYPHELSGGMRQRALLAIALACRPRLLIADEPTTALDVTIQAQILDLIKKLQRELGMALLLITHDQGIVADTCDRVYVMYAGMVVETADVYSLYRRPTHPYTRGLLGASTRIDEYREKLATIEGSVPDPTAYPPHCRFAPRCSYARSICIQQSAELAAVDSDFAHQSRCWLGSPMYDRSPAIHAVAGVSAAGAPSPAARTRRESADSSPLIEARSLTRVFTVDELGLFRRASRLVHAVEGVSLKVSAGETVALVGESGSGKSTTARLLLGLLEPTRGRVMWKSTEVSRLGETALREFRGAVQMIFQNPLASLNPRKSIGRILSEPLQLHGRAKGPDVARRIHDLLVLVGLEPPDLYLRRFPHELSGGQRQRVCIARALSLEPKLIIADEPISSLDVSIQAQILNLMKRLQKELDLSFLFITHDLAVARSLAQRVIVMYLGEVVESGPVESVFTTPLHPYTQALLAATPVPDPVRARERKRIILAGEMPSPLDPPAGCRFHTRCPYVQPQCRTDPPGLHAVADSLVACHFACARPAAPHPVGTAA